MSFILQNTLLIQYLAVKNQITAFFVQQYLILSMHVLLLISYHNMRQEIKTLLVLLICWNCSSLKLQHDDDQSFQVTSISWEKTIGVELRIRLSRQVSDKNEEFQNPKISNFDSSHLYFTFNACGSELGFLYNISSEHQLSFVLETGANLCSSSRKEFFKTVQSELKNVNNFQINDNGDTWTFKKDGETIFKANVAR